MKAEINKNQPEFYYYIKDENLVRDGVFERFPQLIPAVGENYWRADKRHKKMMLIGESNYFKKELESISMFQNAEEWYGSDNVTQLIPQNKSIVKMVSNWKGYKTFVKVFKIANELLQEEHIEAFDNNDIGSQNELTFYNYYLRPALDKGKGYRKEFIPEEIDDEVAGFALSNVIDKLEPELIIFLSKKAYNSFSEYIVKRNITYDFPICAVSHPSSPCWNGHDGKEKFKNTLKKYWINF